MLGCSIQSFGMIVGLCSCLPLSEPWQSAAVLLRYDGLCIKCLLKQLEM
jgi:hypothetical protein